MIFAFDVASPTPVTLFLRRNAVNGYEFIADASLTAKHQRFSRRMSEKYHLGGGHGWMSILLQACHNDEEAAFDLFFEEWDEFCALPEEKVTDDYDENTPG